MVIGGTRGTVTAGIGGLLARRARRVVAEATDNVGQLAGNSTTRRPGTKRGMLFHQPGFIDDSERVFSREERRIAQVLRDEGKGVTAKAEAEMTGQRMGDAEVDGVLTEFKSLEPGGTSSTVRNAINNSVRRGGQARHVFIDARGSGMTRAEAERGFARARNITRGRIDSVRIKGDEFDVTSVDFQ